MEVEVLLLVLGCVFFPGTFYFFVKIQKTVFKEKNTDRQIYAVAVRSVSSIQAIIACCVGFIIITSCKDVLYDRHWLASTYLWFAVPYFYYDAWAMYQFYWHKHPEIWGRSVTANVHAFIRSQPLMMIHHLVLPVLYFPVITYLRGGIGDFFIGCFYCIELAIPCLSLRAILYEFGMEKSLLYNVNGILSIVTFAVCRVLIFPFMYWSYGAQKNLSILKVISSIPVKCNVGCALLLLMQIYWLSQMVAILVCTLRKLLGNRSIESRALKAS